jgi:hypothetical protein
MMIRQLMHRYTKQSMQPGRLEEDGKRVERPSHHEFDPPKCLQAHDDSTERGSGSRTRGRLDFESIAEDELDHRRGTGGHRMHDGRSALEANLALTIEADVLLEGRRRLQEMDGVNGWHTRLRSQLAGAEGSTPLPLSNHRRMVHPQFRSPGQVRGAATAK